MSSETDQQIQLTADELATLTAIAGHIIPADDDLGVPGADDDTIMADILRAARRLEADIRAAIASVDAQAGGSFAALPERAQLEILSTLRAAHPDAARACEVVVARCYYRDTRVMQSIGMEPRPPFPIGFPVESGDWEMLEPVRRRGRIYRNAD